jgi:hypothetical protein
LGDHALVNLGKPKSVKWRSVNLEVASKFGEGLGSKLPTLAVEEARNEVAEGLAFRLGVAIAEGGMLALGDFPKPNARYCRAVSGVQGEPNRPMRFIHCFPPRR